ncbi:hypothetical protein GCM10010210_49830 [Pseudonocardia hydrocarbonoxydans]
MSRHRHTVNVRADGLQAVLGPLLRDRRVVTAVLVDVDSGMVLDAWSSHLGGAELESLGARHAELVRVAADDPQAGGEAPGACEVVVSQGGRWHQVVRTVPDPHGDRLALAVAVTGGRWVLERVRRRLRVVSAAALTAGPTVSRRPGDGGWLAPGSVPPPAAPAVPPPAEVARVPWSVGPPRADANAPGGAPRRAEPAPRGDAALLSLGGAPRRDGTRAAAALESLGPAAPPGPPVLRAVPRPGAPQGAWVDRPRAPISALAPGPRRDPPPRD